MKIISNLNKAIVGNYYQLVDLHPQDANNLATAIFPTNITSLKGGVFECTKVSTETTAADFKIITPIKDFINGTDNLVDLSNLSVPMCFLSHTVMIELEDTNLFDLEKDLSNDEKKQIEDAIEFNHSYKYASFD